MKEDVDALVHAVRAANAEASRLGAPLPEGDARDHLMQAHFRLTEALAHLRVARAALERDP